jgi:hypothetical protein
MFMPILLIGNPHGQVLDMANILDSMQPGMDASNKSLLESQRALKYIETEIAHYESIASSLASYIPGIRAVKLDADTLRQTSDEKSMMSLDVAGFLSQLSAKADTVQLGLKAQELAERVLDIQKVIDGRRPKGLVMWDQPAPLESTLQMIASSSVPAPDVGDLM